MTCSVPAELRQHQQYICADLKQAKTTQNNIIGTTEEDEARQQGSCEETATAAGTVIAETDRQEIFRKMTAHPEEGTEEQTGTRHHQRGRPRKPQE